MKSFGFCAKCGNSKLSKKDCDNCGSSNYIKYGIYIIGANSACDVQMNVETISNQHAQLQISEEGIFLKDLSSSNGTFIGENKIRIDESGKWINYDEIVYFGKSNSFMVNSIILKLSEQLKDKKDEDKADEPGNELKSSEIDSHNTSISIQDSPVIVGRDPICDFTIDFPTISRKHIKITPLNNQRFIVEDMGSSNGLYVKGNRVKKLEIGSGEILGLGSYLLKVTKKKISKIKHKQKEASIIAKNISHAVIHRNTGKPLVLLDNISFSVYPGQLIALLGNSGSGKSTLIHALTGYVPPSKGDVFISNQNLYKNLEQFKGLIGYVPQDDIVYSDLTVFESLYYTAKLRLPTDTTDAEIEHHIDRVLTDLNLKEQKFTKIGSAENKYLSGGQRKRVNLAKELITVPDILILDEPTTGLSSEDTKEVISILRRLADSGKTVMLTIHSPSEFIISMMDKIFILADGGKTAFFGNTETAYDYFNCSKKNPDLILSTLKKDSPSIWQEKFYNSPHYKKIIPSVKSSGKCESTKQRLRKPGPESFHQFKVLLSRQFSIKIKNFYYMLMICLQAPVIAILMGFVFEDASGQYLQRGTPIFSIVIATIFFGCFNASREIVSEKAIYKREKMVNLLDWPYILSKFIYLIIVDLIQVCILLIIVGLIFVKFDGSLITMFAILSLTGIAASALGLLISSFSKKSETAMSLVPMILIPQIILAGFIVPLDKNWLKVGSTPIISRWSIEALLSVENRGLEKKSISNKNCGTKEFRAGTKNSSPKSQNNLVPIKPCKSFRQMVMVTNKYVPDRVKLDALMLAFLSLLFLGGTAVTLRMKNRR